MEINIREIVLNSKDLIGLQKKKLAVKIIIGQYYALTEFKHQYEPNVFNVQEKYEINIDNEKAHNVIIQVVSISDTKMAEQHVEGEIMINSVSIPPSDDVIKLPLDLQAGGNPPALLTKAKLQTNAPIVINCVLKFRQGKTIDGEYIYPLEGGQFLLG
jgi:hypothetical protein